MPKVDHSYVSAFNLKLEEKIMVCSTLRFIPRKWLVFHRCPHIFNDLP